uniref:SEC22 homolog A, vesicle trafficking protein n=1 Tax=Prolemur simus TaxID=1328070 RepID=A0A8C8YQA5_PROSS
MSMILSASVIRVRDGLPLSASTDYEQNTGMQECRKYFKMLSRKLAQLPDRCTVKTGRYNINFISSLGVMLFACLLHRLAECQIFFDFWLNLSMQHVSL